MCSMTDLTVLHKHKVINSVIFLNCCMRTAQWYTDEMGLGKTLQCVGLIGHLIEMGVKGPFLVVAPLSTVTNWVTEFKRFAPLVSMRLCKYSSRIAIT